MSAVIPERFAGKYVKAEDIPLVLEELGTAEAALQAMTIDRDLWQNAHDEDCPNQAMLESTETALSQAQAQVVRLKEALRSLTAKIHELDGNESLKSVLTIAFVHGCKYTGPTWIAELAIADAALADTPDQKEKP